MKEESLYVVDDVQFMAPHRFTTIKFEDVGDSLRRVLIHVETRRISSNIPWDERSSKLSLLE